MNSNNSPVDPESSWDIIHHCTANTYSEITVKTHVKTEILKYSSLLYHAQLFTTLQTHPCNENRVFPVSFSQQGKPCFH